MDKLTSVCFDGEICRKGTPHQKPSAFSFVVMRNIKHLPSAVRSSLRSGVILFDFTRVVEELIFNSLDAGATKVSVAIGIGTCFVKLEDDGSGITRDGLVLLGERYATSKLHHLAERDAAIGSFGFRGEALCSLSDISLLEIITKARGRPSGYRKVMKGCKCLYLGIDDNRQDAGTTVIVRDLFYNQPVRRKCMHSSPKKVLHSVKKCVLRIALVHPEVSFKVIDIESEDELLCTHSSLSPLSLVTSGFGFDVSNSLHKLSFSEGVLKLSGYLSGPGDTFHMKAIQYIYINSRFVCKGPIHKLLNNLAVSYKCLDLWKDETGSQYGKRSRPQAYPTYILNFCCPQSSYDLTFEPSKTIVEFKDWVPVLSFIEQAIKRFWRQIPAQGEDHKHEYEASGKCKMWRGDDNIISPAHDMSVNSEIAKKCRIQYCRTPVCLSPPFCSLEVPSEESDLLSSKKNYRMPSRKPHINTAEVMGRKSMKEYDHSIGFSFQDVIPASLDSSVTKYIPIVSPEGGNDTWAPGNNLFPTVDNLLTDELTDTQASMDYVKDSILCSGWENEAPEVDTSKGSTSSFLMGNHFVYRNDVDGISFPSGCLKSLEKPLLQHCSLTENMPYEGSLFTSHEEFEVHYDDSRSETKPSASDDMMGVVEIDDSNQSFDFSWKTLWQDKVATPHLSSSSIAKCSTTTEQDVFPRDFMKPYPSKREYLTKESDLPNDSPAKVRKISSDHQFIYSDWCCETPHLMFGNASWKVKHFADEFELEGNIRSCRSARHFRNRERKDECEVLSYDTMQNNSDGEGCPISSCIDTGLAYQYCVSPYHGQWSDDIVSGKFGCADNLNDETGWLCLDSSSTDNCALSALHFPLPCNNNKGNNPRDHQGSQNYVQYHVPKGRSRRSHSAPPFYKGKRSFSSIYNHLTTTAGESDARIIHDTPTLPETTEFKYPPQSCVSKQCSEPSLADGSFSYTRTYKEKIQYGQNMNGVQKSEELENYKCFQIYNTDSVEDFISNDLEDSKFSGIKWRNNNPQSKAGNKSHSLHDLNDVLDISSGILHLAGSSLVPESINKDCLEDAKILMQLDKKFIPVMAGGTLAVIDQHAADERIRLEELRHKVLSGEGKTVAYLDSEQELVLPEIGYQLLHNYAEQIKNWGWICNIHAQVSGSFSKNLSLLHRGPSAVTLLAVPCILGVNLSEKDLLEFLEQLAETDGSSSMPPSVLRVLNFKACRGAIMFGDSLLPSECSLIVEELRQTSLCFQCAHGRPTTVPLVNLEALHKQIAELQLWNGGSNELWHGLHRYKPSLKRARQRLSSSRDHCG